MRVGATGPMRRNCGRGGRFRGRRSVARSGAASAVSTREPHPGGGLRGSAGPGRPEHRAGLDADVGRPAVVPTAVWAKPGYFAYDTMTLVGPGTWDAARAAVDVALTAVDLVAAGAPCAYACCRPPGHHVCRACYGGSCYLNNSAVAAAAFADRLGGPVAVLDIDAHHGNGTQEIFWERSDVLVGSVHVDPGAYRLGGKGHGEPAV